MRTTLLNTIGTTNHSTCKASRIIHLQLININVEVFVSDANTKAGRRERVWGADVHNAIKCTREDLNDGITIPGGQNSRSPWAFFFHPLLVVRGLWVCSNAERLSVKLSVSVCVSRSPANIMNGPSSNQAGFISMICLM